MSVDSLARPLELRRAPSLNNRLAKAAMSENLATSEGAPTEALVRLYERLGRGGAGLLITGNVVVDAGGRTEPNNVVLVDDRHHDMLERWAGAAQAHGSQLWMQLSHAGRQTPRMVTWDPVSPSEVALKGMGGLFSRPRSLESEEIRSLIRRFGRAAATAEAAGFAGVQIHGAHGYLVSQFLSPYTNKRTDEWGGDLDHRMRFLLDVVAAVKEATGEGFGIAVKLNSADFQRGGFTLEESMQVAQALEKAGIDFLEISGGSYERPAMVGSKAVQRESTRSREAFFLEYAERMREVVKLPLMLTGGLRTSKVMDDAVSSGAIDIVGLGRPIALQPDLPRELLSGRAEAARKVDVGVGVRLLDDMLQTMWYQRQLQRMSEGLEPTDALNRGWTILIALTDSYKHVAAAAFRRDRRARIGAPVDAAALR